MLLVFLMAIASCSKPAQEIRSDQAPPPDTIGIAPPAEEVKIYTVDLDKSWELYQAENVVVVDSRAADDFGAGHWKGAISLPTDDFDKRWDSVKASVPTDARVLIYCNGPGCDLGERLAALLRDRGYRQIFVSTASYADWQDAGHPVEIGG